LDLVTIPNRIHPCRGRPHIAADFGKTGFIQGRHLPVHAGHVDAEAVADRWANSSRRLRDEDR